MRAILTSGFKCVVVTMAFCVACFETHSADNSDLDQRSVVSESFDPFSGRLKEDDSAAEQLWWRYRINQGKPVTMSLSGDDSITMEFDDPLTIVDPSNSTRLTTVEVSSHSSADGVSGTMAEEVTENLEFGQTTRVVSQRVIIKEEFEEDGETIRAIRDLIVEMDPPMEWVLDRSDLNESEPGEELLQQTYDMHYSGSGDTTIDGQRETRLYDETIIPVTEVWTVEEKHDSFSVQGNNYRNVIEIQRENTMLISGDGRGSLVYTYWVAKGVGVIKEIGNVPWSQLPHGIPIELVETNLVQ